MEVQNQEKILVPNTVCRQNTSVMKDIIKSQQSSLHGEGNILFYEH
jgi:hypothetical protein